MSWYYLLTTFDLCDLDVIARHCQAILHMEQHDHQWLGITCKNHQHQCGTCSTFRLSITSAIRQEALKSSGLSSTRTQHASGKMASPCHNYVLLMITTRIVSGDIFSDSSVQHHFIQLSVKKKFYRSSSHSMLVERKLLGHSVWPTTSGCTWTVHPDTHGIAQLWPFLRTITSHIIN